MQKYVHKYDDEDENKWIGDTVVENLPRYRGGDTDHWLSGSHKNLPINKQCKNTYKF